MIRGPAPIPSRCPWSDLKALIVDPLLLDDQWPAFAGRAVSPAWLEAMGRRSEPLLERLAKDPAPLVEWVARQASHRLGAYFEQLFAFWLKHLDGIHSVYQRRTVMHEGRTLGELDIMCYDQDLGQALHFELAIKFYLQTANAGFEPRSYVGPGAQDRLDIKLDKLFHQQLRLLASPAGSAAVPQDLQNIPMHSLAFVKGGLFYPLDAWLGPDPLIVPRGLTHTAPLGWWVPMGPVPPRAWAGLQAEKWSSLPRLEWMSRAVRERDDPELHDPPHFWELCRLRIQNSGRAIMAVGYGRDGIHGQWLEVTRGFLVPGSWPNTAKGKKSS